VKLKRMPCARNVLPNVKNAAAQRATEAGKEAVSKTAAAVQMDELDKMAQMLDRIHRRVPLY